MLIHDDKRQVFRLLLKYLKKSKENSFRTNTSFGTCTHSGSRISTRIRDASNANYNAVRQVLSKSNILMCWFHVMLNMKKNYRAPLSKEKYQTLLEDLGRLHYTTSKAELHKLVLKLEEDLNVKKSENVLKYVMTWMTNISIIRF